MSAHVSLRERKPAPLPAIVASVFKRSRVRARQPVEARHAQNVAFGKLAEGAAQSGAAGLRAARRFPKDLLGSGGAQLLHLRVEALAIC